MPYYDFYYVPVDEIPDISPCELDILWELIASDRFRYYVEVGVGHLGTLLHIAARVKKSGLACRCIGIDAFGELPEDVQGNNSHQGDVISLSDAENFLASRGLGEVVTLHQGDSAAVLDNILSPIKGTPKLIFIDANHTYEGCRADFEAADMHLRGGDILVFHDTLPAQHPDYGRGPRGVVEDCLLSNAHYRPLMMPPEGTSLNDSVNTMSLFERVSSRPAPE